MAGKIICFIWFVVAFWYRNIPQIQAITHAMQDTFNIPVTTSVIMTALVGLIILGGKTNCQCRICYCLFMAILYVKCTSTIIILF